MRRLPGSLLLVSVLVSLLAACGGDDDGDSSAGTDTDDPLTGREVVSRSVTVDGEPDELVPGTDIRLTFAPGEVRATAGCNSLSGSFEVDGDRLVVGPMGGTEMGCDPERHAQDEWLVAFLMAGPTVTVEGAVLRLEADGTVIELVDLEVADPDRPLDGTAWVLDGLVHGAGPDGTSSSAPSPATLTFDGSELTVSIAGCNSGSGPATVTGPGTIEIEPLTMTLMLCGEPEASTEAAMLAVLQGTVTFEIEAGTLRLQHPDGQGLTFRAE